ncbi:hypothetical protein TcasGA2_TC001586 [Tribolium castaneum]|nr:hypothetical protein TcasGA2_TC001586 [Tribolium castaneum]
MDERKMEPKEVSTEVLVKVYCEIEWCFSDSGDNNMLIKKMKL